VRNEQAATVLQQILGFAVLGAGKLSDRELMQRFTADHDDSAFETLVRRHGAMVLGVCRRILRDEHDAEDAFQATFLVLARKAATLRSQESVGNWLYGVATRLALRARTDAARRRDRERQAPVRTGPDPLGDLTVREAQQILDEELTRLPAKYRATLVLCCLEGLARDEAAQRLGCAAAAVKSRLERGRELLRQRLGRRGLTLPAALLATLLADTPGEAAIPPMLVHFAAKAAAYAAGSLGDLAISPTVVALADKALRLLHVSKLKTGAVLLLAMLVCGSTTWVSLIGFGSATQNQVTVDPPPTAAATSIAQQPQRSDSRGEEPTRASADWPQWRGPNRDGTVHGVAVPATWPRQLTEEWQVPVGEGVASPVVVGGRIFVFTRQKEQEVVVCLDLQSGKGLWRSQPYPAPYTRGPSEGNFNIGPRSTPAVDGGRVYTLGLSGILSCLDAQTGTLRWHKDCHPPGPTAAHNYGGSSPLVADGLCIVHAGDGKTGGLAAFDTMTGDVKWCFSDGYSPMSGSPILVDLAGDREVVTYSSSNAAGVSAITGRKLWTAGSEGVGHPHTTPIRYRDLLILNDILQPLRAIHLDRGEQDIRVTDAWKSKGVPIGYSSPVLAGDLVFGMSSRKNGCFFCLDAATGTTLWESPGQQGDYASILNARSVLLFLTEKGRLIVVKPSATGYAPIAEYHVSDTDTHAHPVFLGDRILIKDALTLRCYRLDPDAKR
jgi:RNA polymerase sigma factor (sigma-70 family)